MDIFHSEEGIRLMGILRNPDGLNIHSRQQFEAIFDNGSDGRCIEGIDEVRSRIFRKLWNLTDQEWRDATNLRVGRDQIIVLPES